MQKEYVKILVRKKGSKFNGQSCEILTFGYKSKNPELYITRDFYTAKKHIKSYGITHAKSGYGFLTGRFASIKKAQKIIKMFFANCNWNQGLDQIVKDPVILAQYQAAQKFLTDNNL